MKNITEKALHGTIERYQSSEYATKYKQEYVSGLSFKHIRSRIIARREVVVIHDMLRSINGLDGLLLDVPCGAGKLGDVLSSFPAEVLAGDISAQMMTLAKDEYNSKKFKGFVRFSASDAPFADLSLNNIVCLRLFQRLPAEVRKRILREFKRIVRSNLIVSYSYSSTWQKGRQQIRSIYDKSKPIFFHVDIKDIVNELEEAGFATKKWKYVLPGLSSEVILHAKLNNSY